MSEWQPINTAPVDTNVEVGRWDTYLGERKWETSFGMAFESSFFGLIKTRQYAGRFFTHWRHLPPPPSATNQTEDAA